MKTDRFGQDQTATTTEAIDRWDDGWSSLLHFQGDPLATMASALEADDDFTMGAVFNGVYRVLGGSPPGGEAVQRDLAMATSRSAGATERERQHVAALASMVEGEFTTAAAQFDDIAAKHPRDIAAVKFAHDVYLHVGDAPGRYQSAVAAHERWEPGSVGFGTILGDLAFACEEIGDYRQAEAYGREALAIDPLDTWALHALAHVFESQDRTSDALQLLATDDFPWRDADLLSTHVWWHLALRHIALGDHVATLDIFDRLVDAATTAFRLGDLTSLLWRLGLVGCDVGGRWQLMADRWASIEERHTCAFLDMHATMAFGAVPEHPDGAAFFTGLEQAHRSATSENSRNFVDVLMPVVEALRLFAGAGDRTQSGDAEQIARATQLLAATQAQFHRIGGSIAQLEILHLTLEQARSFTTDRNP